MNTFSELSWEYVDIFAFMDKIVLERTQMKRSILLVLCATAVSALFAADVDDVIQKTLEKYENLRSLYTEFNQFLCDELSGTCQNFEGEIYYLKPHYFRMEIKDPKRIYVGDSIYLWIYIPEEKKAIRQHLEQVPFAINPDFFLKDYAERFTAELIEDEKDVYLVSLTPRQETEIYEKITISISKPKYEIAGVTVRDKTGSESTFNFDNIEVNKKMSKKLFEFNPPDGTTIDEY